jgi:hypothetical protein
VRVWRWQELLANTIDDLPTRRKQRPQQDR